jgi:5-hydroxyisourate hydrolase
MSQMSQITTHILDTTKGKPVAGVTIILYHHRPDGWHEIGRGVTNQDGRVTDLLPIGGLLAFGTYKIIFFTKEYFDRDATPAFYPFVEICFEVATNEHYHVPLLLNPFGYATYRGS